jgi:hypothetical protein
MAEKMEPNCGDVLEGVPVAEKGVELSGVSTRGTDRAS